jgi:hypothetical protein
MIDVTLDNERIKFESLARIAKAMLYDAARVAITGSKEELEEVERWIQEPPNGAWDFETTCHICKLDESKERQKIQRNINARRQVERSL